MKSIALILAAVLAAGTTSVPAVAQNAAKPVRISYAGLDLNSADGRAALDLRIVHAARAACGTPSPADLLGRRKIDDCLTQFRNEAERQRDIVLARAARPSEPAFALSR